MLVNPNRRPRVTEPFSTVGATYDVDVTGLDTLLIDCSSNDVTIGGLAGGIHGQVLHIVRGCNAGFSATLNHDHASATQKLYLHKAADESLSTEYGGWTFICVNGTHWVDTSHAKHV